MRYNQNSMKDDAKIGIFVTIIAILGIIVLLIPVNDWWIFGENNVPKMLQDTTLITTLIELQPAIFIIIFVFLLVLFAIKVIK